ncbi:MAG: hypothetical protein ACRDFS_12240 [Chloroflexota bacterium]
MRALDMKRGITINAADGAELGKVHEVWAKTSRHGYLPMSLYRLEDYGPITGNQRLFDVDDGYLHIKQGDLLGGSRDLFVPLDRVAKIWSENRATLRAGADACEAWYSATPGPLADAA